MSSTPWLSWNAVMRAPMYRPTPVASSVRARASSATRSGRRRDASGSGVAIDAGPLRERLHALPGGEWVEVIGPHRHAPVASRRNVGLANDRQHQRAGRRRNVERIAIVPDDTEAELAEHSELVHRDLR